ncbi:hypothetical protein SNEBB_002311 [Seison nebaliae]|nr:hypothetical protein SNEBB_002311 [Seison nebaliae]
MKAGRENLYIGKESKSTLQLIQLDYDDLSKKSDIITDEIIRCNCGAVFSILSQKNITEVNGRKWTCEFCSYVNDITHLSNNQIENIVASDGCMSYQLEEGKIVKNENLVKSQTDESGDNKTEHPVMVVFVIDISGSMGAQVKEMKENWWNSVKKVALRAFYNRVQIFTVLDAVKNMTLKAINFQKENFPENKLSLITFETNVKCYGDFSSKAKVEKAGCLSEKNEWTDFATDFIQPLPIKNCYGQITRSVTSLRTAGCTALGPALYSAVRYASRTPGSRVVMLTDGQANVGFGNSGDKKFYHELGQLAKECGVIIDLMSVKNCDCNLKDLGHVALLTEGDVRLFDPQTDSNDFAEMLKIEQIASNVETTFRMPKGFQVIDATNEEENIRIVEQGNVVTNVQETFEIRIKDTSNDNILKWKEKKIPYQAQIKYRKMDGSKFLKIYSNEIEATNEMSNLDTGSKYQVLMEDKHFLNLQKQDMINNVATSRELCRQQMLEDHLQKKGLTTSITTDNIFSSMTKALKKR